MTNHDLARAATDKLWKQDRQTFESVSTIIADTYAPAMAELERLRFALVNVIVHTGHLRTINTSTEQLLDGLLKNIARIAKEALKDCPHNNEVAT